VPESTLGWAAERREVKYPRLVVGGRKNTTSTQVEKLTVTLVTGSATNSG
jgi:hypothetical protein